MENIGIVTAFVFGLLSFVSPCVLPIVPGYISFISGFTLEEMKDGSSRKAAMRSIVLNSLFFIMGFAVVFILMGATATSVGKILNENLELVSKIAGVLIVIFGLHMAGVFKVNFLNYEKRFHLQDKKFGVVGSFLIGTAFAFGWTPCIGPVLAGILLVAAQQETVVKGMILLASYSLGLGIPFFLTGISINLFFGFFNRIKKYFHAIEIIGGGMLVVLGVLIFTGYLTVIASYIARWLPFLNEIG
jgi:cytochrome c-type biogenesis protein